MKFTEAKLEQVFIELLSAGEMEYSSGEEVKKTEAVLSLKGAIQTGTRNEYS